MEIKMSRHPSMLVCSGVVMGFAVVSLGAVPALAAGAEGDTEVTFS